MRILLVEDEIFLANSTTKKLNNKNIKVDTEYDGEKALDMILNDNYDLIILDIMLPKMDGLTIVREVRKQKNSVPIILTSAKGSTDDKVLGLEAGADDYLTKPYEFVELLARINTNLRRVDDSFVFNNENFGNVSMDRNSLSIIVEGNNLNLTLKEFDLLEYLISSNPNFVSKEQIINKIWGYNADVLPSHVEVYISYLRKKLRLIHANIQITTVRGVGYKVEIKE